MKKRFSLLLLLILVLPLNPVFANDDTINNQINDASNLNDIIHDEESIVNSFLLDTADMLIRITKVVIIRM